MVDPSPLFKTKTALETKPLMSPSAALLQINFGGKKGSAAHRGGKTVVHAELLSEFRLAYIS